MDRKKNGIEQKARGETSLRVRVIEKFKSACGADKGTLKCPQLHLQWIMEEKNHHHGHIFACDSSVCAYK